MLWLRLRRPVTTLCLAAALVALSAPAATLEQVLATLDKSGPAFRDMSANLRRVQHTAILKETEESRGLVRMKRAGGRDIRMLVEFKEPEAAMVAFQSKEVQKYYPKLQLVEIYDLGKLRSVVDQFLLLGFGSTGAELKRNYNLKVMGDETIEGQPATRVDLTPLSPSVLEYLKRAELWLAPAGHPVQQKIYTSTTGDYFLFSYSGVKINTDLPDAAVRLQLPGGVKRERRK
jgi:outer membrane lipoprotein-sorting protein